jgi:dolichol-phosphate mannosyltransferase
MKGGNPGEMPLHRIICTRLYPYLIRLMLGFPATEGTNGFRAYRTSLFDDPRINLWQDWLNGVELEYYIQVQVIRLGYRIKEVPVSKTYPSTKMHTYRHYTKANPWGILNNLKPIFYLTLGIRK